MKAAEDLDGDGRVDLLFSAGRPAEPYSAAVLLDAATGTDQRDLGQGRLELGARPPREIEETPPPVHQREDLAPRQVEPQETMGAREPDHVVRP